MGIFDKLKNTVLVGSLLTSGAVAQEKPKTQTPPVEPKSNMQLHYEATKACVDEAGNEFAKLIIKTKGLRSNPNDPILKTILDTRLEQIEQTESACLSAVDKKFPVKKDATVGESSVDDKNQKNNISPKKPEAKKQNQR
jgi:hypothetical protein